MNNRDKLEDIKRYKEITEGIKDKVSNQSNSMAKGAYFGSLEKLKKEVKYGCGIDCTQNRAVATEPDFCGDGFLCCDCEELINKIDALLGDSEK